MKTKKGTNPKVPTPSEEAKKKAVEEAAYFRWLNRGATDGEDTTDWLDAEQEALKNIFEKDSP